MVKQMFISRYTILIIEMPNFTCHLMLIAGTVKTSNKSSQINPYFCQESGMSYHAGRSPLTQV